MPLYQIITYKTGDIAKKLAAMKNVIVSTNARIIYRAEYQNGITTTKYIIGDKNQPVDILVDVGNIFSFAN